MRIREAQNHTDPDPGADPDPVADPDPGVKVKKSYNFKSFRKKYFVFCTFLVVTPYWKFYYDMGTMR
jgi:hypothetical protein